MYPNKCVVIGDSGIGKTSMVITYAVDKFPEFVPTMFWELGKNISYDNKDIYLEMWDTCGREDYDRLRPLSYPNSDAFLLCFSVMNKTSFENIKTKYYPEIRSYRKTPILLVGTKIDLRDDENENDKQSVTYEEGLEMAKDIKAVKYFECSAIKQIGLKEIFEEVTKIILYPPPKKKLKCLIM